MDDIFGKLSELNATQHEILAIQANQQKTLDKQTDMLERHNEILLKNTLTVEEHHRRSTLLEEELKRIDSEVTHIRTHVDSIKLIGSIGKWLTYVGGAISIIYEIFKNLGH